ncbi:MAG: apolipoprotein N-acyltransferase [Phycisphaerae bacterium]
MKTAIEPASAVAAATRSETRLAHVLSFVAELRRTTFATLLTVLLFSLIFPPLTIWPLAFVCLMPWTARVLRAERTAVLYWVSFVGGWLFFLINLYWLMPVTGLGYAALAFYLAMYWPMAAWAVRTARRIGLGATWSLPIAWVACEYLRGWVMSGFPWLFVAHSLYRQLPLIQISDLTGAYGVSFLAAMVNGLLAELYCLWRQRAVAGLDRAAHRKRVVRMIITTALVGFVFAGVSGYGAYQVAAVFQPGPRVAVVQDDFPLVSTPPYGAPPPEIFAQYLRMGETAARQGPDLIAFPETMWGACQNLSFLNVQQRAVEGVRAEEWPYGKLCHDATAAFALGDFERVNQLLDQLEHWLREKRTLPRLDPRPGPQSTLLLGSLAIDVLPEASYPRIKKYNSALVYDRDGTQRRERYDKMHLVPFGEIVPFRQQKILGIDLHPLYRALNNLSPFSQGGNIEYSLWPGQDCTLFDLRVGERTYRFGTPICYEDVMPRVIRRFVWKDGQRRADFLVNISNDGWFQHSAELPQHLAICAFRAIENRVAIARAVNTGISGFIDPNGRIYGLVNRDGQTRGEGIRGVSIERVPIDTRGSFYGRWGDWFAGLCLLLATGLWVGAIATRWVASLVQHVSALLSGRRRTTDAS